LAKITIKIQIDVPSSDKLHKKNRAAYIVFRLRRNVEAHETAEMTLPSIISAKVKKAE
jgi:hypothetical protein